MRLQIHHIHPYKKAKNLCFNILFGKIQNIYVLSLCIDRLTFFVLCELMLMLF